MKRTWKQEQAFQRLSKLAAIFPPEKYTEKEAEFLRGLSKDGRPHVILQEVPRELVPLLGSEAIDLHVEDYPMELSERDKLRAHFYGGGGLTFQENEQWYAFISNTSCGVIPLTVTEAQASNYARLPDYWKEHLTVVK